MRKTHPVAKGTDFWDDKQPSTPSVSSAHLHWIRKSSKLTLEAHLPFLMELSMLCFCLEQGLVLCLHLSNPHIAAGSMMLQESIIK
ncbi:hypothetical protein HanRHA438_Chr04g0150121 [Helianthus annuus]|nr:hypothetical protein HanRHA438_Chr04g0150121 [Helianthus annuus]